MPALTYLNPKMIKQPANISYLSAGTLIASNVNLDSANVNTLSAYNSYLDNIINNIDVYGNLTVYGAVTALSGITLVNTFNTSTTALSVINIGTGPALYISQGENINGVALFVGASGQEILRVNNIDPNFNQPTVIITKGPTNRSLSANGTATFETINGQLATLTNLNATSATIGVENVTTSNVGAVNANTIKVNSISASNLQMPNDSYAFFGNMTVYGQINALSGIQNISSFVSQTSSLSVVSVAQAPALLVRQTGAAGSVASFYGNTVEVLKINNTVVNTGAPGIVVTGSISGSNLVQAAGGDSNNWNSVYTTVRNTSSTWLTFNTLSSNNAVLANVNAGNITAGAINATSFAGTGNIATTSGNITTTNGNITTTNGNVGIGTASPTQKLEVVGNQVITANSSSPALRINQTGSGNVIEVEDNTYPDSTLFKVSETGQVTVGTTSSADSFASNGAFNVLGTARIANFVRYDNSATAAALGFYKTRSGDPNTHSLVQAGNNIAAVIAHTSDGTSSYVSVGSIIVQAHPDFTPSVSSLPTRINFNTTNPGSITVTNKMFVDQNGLTVNGLVSAVGVKYATPIATSTINVSAGQIVGVNTTSSSVSAILPLSGTLTTGDMVRIFDSHRKWDVNNCIIHHNGTPIEGVVQNIEGDIAGSMVTLIYVDASRGWTIIN